MMRLLRRVGDEGRNDRSDAGRRIKIKIKGIEGHGGIRKADVRYVVVVEKK
jgi:hypothetical protein